MKTIYASLVMLLVFTVTDIFGQTDKATVERLVASKDFVFKATRANPVSEPSLNQIVGPTALNNMLDLTGGRYQVKVKKDEVLVDLPFFGRSYVAPMNPNETGIKYTTKEFNYSSDRKKKSWIITIEPKDVQNSEKLFLRVSESGFATLNVNSYNRQSISFEGYIEAANPN